MTEAANKFTVAAVQAAPVFLDLEATIEKACTLIGDAASGGASLVVFPESFVPAYPDWVWAVPAGQGGVLKELHARLLDNALEIPGVAMDRICDAARQHGVHVALGATERNTEASGGSLYNTVVFVDDVGDVLGLHRKLVPTGGERMVWARGDGSTMQVWDTKLGKVGGLICWENYMPLARYAMYAWGTQVYLAPTWDRGEPWISTMRHIAREGRGYVIGCCMALRKSDLPDDLVAQFYQESGEWINSGDSLIVDPDGNVVAGPLHEEEGILYAEVDRAEVAGNKWMLDVAGHYARPDVFQMSVDRSAKPLAPVEARGGDEAFETTPS